MRIVLEAAVVLPIELYVLERLTVRVRLALGSTPTEDGASKREEAHT